MNIQFCQYYVTNDEKKVKVSYSLDNRIDARKCVTIYSSEYGNKKFSDIFGKLAKNDSDSMRDYFEKSHVDIFEDNEMYAVAREKAEYYIKKIRERRAK